MFIKVSALHGVQLEDRNNFRAFKIVVHDTPDRIDDVRRALAGLAELPDAEMAWVLEDALRRRPEVANDAAWQQALGGMVEKAKPHGWIDASRNAIKAHIEWMA